MDHSRITASFPADKMLPRSISHKEQEHPLTTERTILHDIRDMYYDSGMLRVALKWRTTSGQRAVLKRQHNRRSRRWLRQVIQEEMWAGQEQSESARLLL